MYRNAAYLGQAHEDIVDTSKPLIITAAGHRKVNVSHIVTTLRPDGRNDYQLIYIASGNAHFFFDGTEHILSAGTMVLYRPKERQEYIYYRDDHPEVYWVHFTGTDVENLLQNYNLNTQNHILNTGTSPSYEQLFRRMIQELQLCRPHFENVLTLQFQELLIAISRHTNFHALDNAFARKEVEFAVHYFNENYNQEIIMKDYAASRHMSVSWFSRNFKRYYNMTPLNYLMNIRISNAKTLLENTSYNITEISSIVGYNNPLYFSRLFHKHEGISPREYRLQKTN